MKITIDDIPMMEEWKTGGVYHKGTGDRGKIIIRFKEIQPGWHPVPPKLTGYTGGLAAGSSKKVVICTGLKMKCR